MAVDLVVAGMFVAETAVLSPVVDSVVAVVAAEQLWQHLPRQHTVEQQAAEEELILAGFLVAVAGFEFVEMSFVELNVSVDCTYVAAKNFQNNQKNLSSKNFNTIEKIFVPGTHYRCLGNP